MTVRKVMRRGERRLVIDIVYKGPDGSRQRYRRDAQVQNLEAARREERERIGLLQETGSPGSTLNLRCAADSSNGGPPSQSVRPATPTFSTVVEQFLGDYAASRFKASTRIGYKAVLDGFLLVEIGAVPIDQVGAETVRRLDAKLVKRGLTRSTRRNAQLVLRSILCRFCVEQKILDHAPGLPPLPAVGEVSPQRFTDDEVQRVLDLAKGALHIAFLLAVDAGLRAGEIRALRWRHVDLMTGKLTVAESTCRGVTDVPKSGRSRQIPLSARLRDALSAVSPQPADGYVTGPDAHSAWGQHALLRAFKRIAALAGVRAGPLHSLRSHFVSVLFRSGVGAPTVQKLVGHSSLATTQRYATATEVDLQGAIDRLDRARG